MKIVLLILIAVLALQVKAVTQQNTQNWTYLGQCYHSCLGVECQQSYNSMSLSKELVMIQSKIASFALKDKNCLKARQLTSYPSTIDGRYLNNTIPADLANAFVCCMEKIYSESDFACKNRGLCELRCFVPYTPDFRGACFGETKLKTLSKFMIFFIIMLYCVL